MPTFMVTEESTGRELRLTGDSPPTEQELKDIFSTVATPHSNTGDTKNAVIHAELADGRVLEFPDGTNPAVIQETVKRVLSKKMQPGEATKGRDLFANEQSPTKGRNLFDPDAYIANKKGRNLFDPDAYLATPRERLNELREKKAQSSPRARLNQLRELKEKSQQDSQSTTETQQEISTFDLITGESRMTPQMDNLQEIGGAPELNEMSMGAFKSSLGLMTTGKTEELKAILSQQFGDKVSFEEDEKGNTLVNLPSGQFALNKPGLSGQDVARGLFDFAAFTPAGKAASIPAAIAKNAATEAVIEGAEASVGGEFSGEDVAIAGSIGGAFKGAENLVGAGFRVIKGNSNDDVIKAGELVDIPVLTSDIRQPKTFAGKTAQQTGEKIPLAGTGGIREKQQELREQAVDKVIEKYGEFSYSAIVDSLKTQKDRIKNAAGSVLEGVGNKLDGVGEIPLDNTRAMIGEVSESLSKRGVIQSGSAIDDLQTLINALDETPQTFTSLKENRTAFREIVKGADKADRAQLTSRAKSLLKKVEHSMTKDMDTFSKKHLDPREFSQWKKANSVYAEEATKLTKTKLKNVLDKGDVTPESVQTMLFSQKPSEVGSLYKSLTPSGRANARSAIISKIVLDLNKRSIGVTPNAFLAGMKKHGLPLNLFFKGEEKQVLSGLIKALNATKRAQEASVTTPTGQQLLGAGSALALSTAPTSTLLTGATLGTIARLYESAPVRNALLRLDSLPARSTRFETALLELQTLLNATAQAGSQTMRETESDRK